MMLADWDTTTAVYVGVGIWLAAYVLVLVVWSLLRRRSRTQSPNENLLDAIIEQQSPGSGPSSGAYRMSAGRREEGCSSQQLEGHLRAILDPNAKERLVKDAMRIADGGRAAAIRQVLRDLDDEGKRLS
jgi:hypothetical protein